MKFCDVCDNMMYLSLDEEDRLRYLCKNCHYALDATEGGSDPDRRQQPTCILGKEYVDDDTKVQQYANPNIKYDATLPRVNAIPCINPACSKPADADNEVIYVKYDRENMRFLYYCCFCETFWRSARE